MMNLESVINTYRRYAGTYDAWFGPILHPGRKLIVQSMACRPEERVLEVGVGTGLSLPLYPKGVSVTGIDVSKEMLAKAERRVARQGLTNVEGVLEMDGQNMGFDDHSFDKVVAMYVVSVVPDPVRLVDEMRRVCKPEGDIFIVNHFHSRNPLLGGLERAIAPFSAFAGFRPDLDLNEFLHGAKLALVDRRKANLFGYWTMLHCRASVQPSG